ncbi:CFI-box-CTERM domain-containing protein [Pseudomonas sp.]|uniref:CFI-box-CTERM domain-containing protein n=1 Tax=Pseudomonas sp. TaxID=306 RepID=UPI00289824DC|nr:CFI-box-CTERM domain-containing protein [Pseudomonas sp.]
MSGLLGEGVGDIRSAFLSLGEDALDQLLDDYGQIHGANAGQYARKAYPKWKDGTTKLSGRTMERLVELVPPYLEPEQRHNVLLKVLKKHKRIPPSQTIKVNINEPQEGFRQIDEALAGVYLTDPLAYLPEHVMEAAKWLYDDDMTAARAMLAESMRIETDMLRTNATRELGLMRRTISSGQVKSATYTVETPALRLHVIAYSPSMCYVATVCFGQQSPKTNALRAWRDSALVNHHLGRKFIVWYYQHGERMADIAKRHSIILLTSQIAIGILATWAQRHGSRHER